MSVEHDGEPLVGLQERERPRGEGDALAALGLLGRAGAIAGNLVKAIVAVQAGDETLPRSTHGKRLPARYHLHPRSELVGRARRRLGQQDLDGPLVSVLRIVRAQRVAAGRAAKGRFRRGEHP